MAACQSYYRGLVSFFLFKDQNVTTWNIRVFASPKSAHVEKQARLVSVLSLQARGWLISKMVVSSESCYYYSELAGTEERTRAVFPETK